MYYYVYDIFVNDQKYKKSIQKIENRLTDLGISGRKVQLSLLKSLRELVEEQYNAGIRNFVAIGNDISFLNLINVAAQYDITVGYIPVAPGEPLAEMFGLPPEDLACDILSARITKKVDLGKINHYYFLTGVKIHSQACRIVCEDSYSVDITRADSSIEIINIPMQQFVGDFNSMIDPQDGRLNLVIQSPSRPGRGIKNLFRKSKRTVSFFTIKNLDVIQGKQLRALVDGCRTVKLPLKITVEREKIRIIVGKNRKIFL